MDKETEELAEWMTQTAEGFEKAEQEHRLRKRGERGEMVFKAIIVGAPLLAFYLAITW